MNAKALLFLLPLALWACQDTLFPVAPDVPERVTVGSPDPSSSAAPKARGPYGGQLVQAGQHHLEFVGFTPAKGSYTLYVFPWDSAMNPVFRTAASSQAKLKASTGTEFTLTPATNPDDGSLFFYAFPEPAFETQSATLQAEVTLGTTLLKATFTHPDR